MESRLIQRQNRVKNAIVLTLSAKSQGKAGWTVQEFAKVDNCTEMAARQFIYKLKELGYINKQGRLYYWDRIISKNLERDATLIAQNFNRNIYVKTFSKSLLRYTDSELITECKRRKLKL